MAHVARACSRPWSCFLPPSCSHLRRCSLRPRRRSRAEHVSASRASARRMTTSAAQMAAAWPIAFDDVIATRERLAPFLTPTPLRHYPLIDEFVGGSTSLAIKHENHQPTGSFKVRNGLSVVTALAPEERARGVVAASTGNH